MSKKRYMELLLEQIRNKRAKELVAHEITSHIEDQEEAYRAQGLTAYDAERRAVLDMGDPVETGVSLDAVHKPKMSWSMVILTVMISLLGVFTIGMICKGTSDFSTLWYTGHPLSCISYLAGYAICTPLFQCGNNSLSAQYPHFLRITVQISKTKLVSSADSCWIYACIYPANALPMVLCIL